jgi:Sec-independent protein translocase protein TatA
MLDIGFPEVVLILGIALLVFKWIRGPFCA